MAVATTFDLLERLRVDPDFRERAKGDLDALLAAEGYELSDEDLKAVREMHRRASGMTDEEIDAILMDEVSGHLPILA